MEKLHLGIDIGGWKIRGILWDGWRVVRAAEIPTPRTKAAFIRNVQQLMGKLAGWTGTPVRGIGIAAAGRCSGTRVLSSTNIPYLRDFDFRTLRQRATFRVGNDAQAFARAEATLGAGRKARRMLALTIGTGIGRAYAERGRVRIMKQFEHAEPWEREYQRIRDRGDTRALASFLGKRLAAIARRYKPDTIVLGGGVLGRRGLTERLKAEFAAHGLTANVHRGRLGPNAAAIGAALLFSA